MYILRDYRTELEVPADEAPADHQLDMIIDDIMLDMNIMEQLGMMSAVDIPTHSCK